MRLTISLFILFSTFIGSAQEVNIIPQPKSVKQPKIAASFTINAATQIVLEGSNMTNAVNFLNDYLQRSYQFKLKVVKNSTSKNVIHLNFERLDNEMAGAYNMTVDGKGVYIAGDNEDGVFYGIQTLIQLLPLPDFRLKMRLAKLDIPYISIEDAPRFAYRGLHLDCGRHFWSVDFIKKYIDYIALHKMNYFHWHLTEDQGWRIEIKKYPKLTSVGGWRNGTIIGRYPGTGNDNIIYGGFYTQEQVKEIVKYAADRYITVVPEIEMPGHSSAAIAAYPELSCFPDKPTVIPTHPSLLSQMQHRIPTTPQDTLGYTTKLVQETWGVFDDVFCAGKENTFKFLEDVMDEVLALFPSKYIHVGGDESPKAHWKLCPACQQRIKDNKLKDEHELQSYFIQRMEKYLNKKGRTLIGWDEILEGGLAPNAVVMSWRGEKGGIDAAKENHDVIMTPGNPVYFDHTQSENEDSVTIGGYNPIEKVYAYEPVPKELNEEQAKHVLGSQANMWTEYMKNTSKVEYMLFPRLAALSEVLWSHKENRDWKDFEKRLMGQFKRYDLWKVNFSKAYFDLKATVLPTEDYNGVYWLLTSKNKGELNVGHWAHDRDAFEEISKTDSSLKIRIFHSNNYTAEQSGKGFLSFLQQKFSFNKATGKKITLTNEASKTYPGDGAFTLVNGVQNEKGLAKAKEFLGFSGTDCEAIIDFGKEETINSIKIHVLDQQSSWIYPPAWINVFYSTDGINFTEATNAEAGKAVPGEIVKDIEWGFYPASKTRYLKVFLKNFGTIPDGKPGAGNKAWLFVDEIEVK